MANHDPTTPSRRSLLGASAAMLLLAAPAAGTAKAAELDGDLLTACARFHQAEAHLHSDPGSNAAADELDRALDDWYAALAAVSAVSPRTPEGIQAKARVAYVALADQILVSDKETLEEEATLEQWAALQVLRDVAGRAFA